MNDTTKLCRSAMSEGTIQFGNLGNLRYTPTRLPSPHAFFSLWHIVKFLFRRKIKRHVRLRQISCKHPHAWKDHSDCLTVSLSLNCQLLPDQPKAAAHLSTPGPRCRGILGRGHKTDLDVQRRAHGSILGPEKMSLTGKHFCLNRTFYLNACCWLQVSLRSQANTAISEPQRTLNTYSTFPHIVSVVLSANLQSKP